MAVVVIVEEAWVKEVVLVVVEGGGGGFGSREGVRGVGGSFGGGGWLCQWLSPRSNLGILDR